MTTEQPTVTKRLSFPHPLTLLVGCILLAAALTWIVPAGEYDRRDDEVTGRSVVVAGTYEAVEPAPVGLFDALVAIPRGMADAADVVFLVFLIGGAFTVVDETGALRRGVSALVGRLKDRELLVVPIVSVVFAAGGALENMQEEIIALIPVLLILTRRIGFTPMVAVAMSAGAAFVGSAFSPVNPFQVGIAQKLADLPLLSGGLFRMAFFAVALTFWILTTMQYARGTRVAPEAVGDDTHEEAGARDGLIFGIVLATFAVLVYGLVRLGWDFDHLSGLFFGMGIVVGLIGSLGIDGTAKAYLKGFREMAFAALLIGFARAIYVVLDDGRIVDSLVHGLFTPIDGLPTELSALGMILSHVAVHVPVPSVSGQAVLTMPILVPLSDLLGISRQVTVLAYQMGAGLCDMWTPTNGALLAVLAAAGVRFDVWFRFVMPRYLALMGLGAVMVLLGMALGI